MYIGLYKTPNKALSCLVYKSMPPQRVWFLAFLALKRVYTLPILVWIRVGFSKKLRERMKVFKP